MSGKIACRVVSSMYINACTITGYQAIIIGVCHNLKAIILKFHGWNSILLTVSLPLLLRKKTCLFASLVFTEYQARKITRFCQLATFLSWMVFHRLEQNWRWGSAMIPKVLAQQVK